MMKNIVTLVSAIALLTLMACSSARLDQVKVEGGIVQGVEEDSLLVFKGIPFAKPPVGDLRWKAPQPVEKWEGVLLADSFAPGPKAIWPAPSGNSEDCLYLNVWTPAKSAKDRIPVLVWIYGGGFAGGATSDPMFNGAKLAKKGVVYVSIPYRLGSLGFLAHPELTAESPNKASGNYGLMDLIAGLEWIQKNIAAFGGDPDKVTIFGESAGGIAVSMLCASPLAKGLFHGAISQSGGSFGPTRPTTYPGENMKLLEDAEREGVAYAESAGVSSIAELRQIEADSLPRGRGWPIVDGYVIPDDQHVLYQAGAYNDVAILVGYNSDEGASFVRTNDPQEFITSVKERYGQFADTLLAVYPVAENAVPKTARDLARDAAFGWHTWSWARLQAQKGTSKVFFYYFDQHPDYPEDSPKYGSGSPHGQEVAYVFKYLNPTDPNVSETDLQISEAMATYWTNFAKYGDPNGEGVPNWPAFTLQKPDVLYFAQKPYVGPVPDAEALEVLDDYFEWRRTPEGKAWAQ